MERDPDRPDAVGEPTVTRRSVLANSAAALGAGAVAAGGFASGAAAAQITEAAAIPEPTKWSEGTNFAGFMLHVGESANVTPGKLYIVNRFNRCDSDFLGVALEQIGLSEVGVDLEEDGQANAATTTADDGGSGAFGPGFGPVAAVAALLGAGALLGRRAEED